MQRTIHAQVPPKVEYQLTSLGEALRPTLRARFLTGLTSGKRVVRPNPYKRRCHQMRFSMSDKSPTHSPPRIRTEKSHSQEQHRSGGLRFQPNAVIHRILQALLTAKVTLCRLDGHVPEQELYLFEFSASLMTQAGASPAKVVRSHGPKPQSKAAFLTIE